MKLRFPLDDVKVEQSLVRKEVSSPLYQDGFYSVSQNEFSMDVSGVAWFYVSGGNYISIIPYPGANRTTVELYLNGSAYGAVLHQRKIMPLHGSCFRYKGRGVMICGDTGAGKSSLTAAFCLDGAEFLTDDVTPLLFKNRRSYIWALSDRIKLWKDTLKQLEREEEGLHHIGPVREKFYFPMESKTGGILRLKQIYIIGVRNIKGVEFEELSGSSKFTALRNEIYRYEYLQGMPENEPVYFRNLLDICNSVKIFRVLRPEDIRIIDLMKLMENHISDKQHTTVLKRKNSLTTE